MKYSKLVGDLEMLVSLYWDDNESKGNILLTMNDRAHERSLHYPAHVPFPLVCARRSGSGVRLMNRTHVGGEMIEWAFLEFATYESTGSTLSDAFCNTKLI